MQTYLVWVSQADSHRFRRDKLSKNLQVYRHQSISGGHSILPLIILFLLNSLSPSLLFF